MSNKGTIAKWLTDRNYGFIQPEGTKGREHQIFMHRGDANLPDAKFKEGTIVEYETASGQKGLKAVNVRLPGAEAAPPPAGYRFHNPYNFVRTLPYRQIDPSAPKDVQLLGRMMPPPHDRWMGLSGKIECQLTTITPLFLSGAEGVDEKHKISEKKIHYLYRFFRLNGKKAIPASSLRGCVRSVFEAVTNSTFSHFGGERLSYRLPSSEVQKLVPARVEKVEKGDKVSWVLRLLPGAAPFAPEVGQKKGLYAAPSRFYVALKPTGRRRTDPPPPIGDPGQWQHGKPYYAVLQEVKFPPSWRVLDLCEDPVTAEKSRSRFARESRGANIIVKQGWLCKTNQNSDNKNSERFFYRDESRTDVPETIPLPETVHKNYEALIQDYQKRHEADVKKRKHPAKVEGKDIAYSRFVMDKKEAKLRGGELVYVSLHGRSPNLKVMFIAPVSWPRVAYDHTIAELLPFHLHRPTDYKSLDPAGRVFGWVHGDGRKEDSGYAGRVKFSSALLEGKENNLEETTLSILGSPKPTTTRFYLVDQKTGQPQNGRSDKEAGYDGNNKLRGRKMYRHFIPNEKHMIQEEQSDQNRSIKDAERAGSTFNFSVTFENLAPVELGALLWSLTLDGKGYHKLGYGKPLGLGSVEITAKNVTYYHQVNRYQALTNLGEHELPASRQKALVDRFQEALCRHYVTNEEILMMAEKSGISMWKIVFEDLPNVADIFALLSKQPSRIPVHYPYSPDPNSNGSFEWFVGNNRLKGPRVELGLAPDQNGLHLISRDGETHP